MKNIIRLFCAITVGIFAGLLFNRIEDLKRQAAKPPVVITMVVPGQPEVVESESKVQASVVLATNLPEDVTLVLPSNVAKKVSFRVEPKMSLTATQQPQPNNQ